MSSALLESIAIKYAKSKGLDYISKEATEYAKKLLGIDKQEGNPKYAISLGEMKIDPMRLVANEGIKNVMGGGSSFFSGALPMLAGGLGLAYFTNPLRPGSYNYNPQLQNQINYASGQGLTTRNNSAGLLRYSPKSALRGQNVVSGFGTNDYAKQLEKYINKFDKYDDLTPGQQSKKSKAQEELMTYEFDLVDKFMEEQSNNNNNGGGKQSPGAPGAPSHSTRDLMAKGGITNVNMNKGQLGEQLRG